MHIIKVGFNHQIAPLAIREKLSFSESELETAMRKLNDQYQMKENVIISTCNRTELFALVHNAQEGLASIKQFLLDWFKEDKDEIAPYLQHLKGDEAIKHLYKLAVGLDSLVIGETQILGQVRDAFLTAQQIRATGKIFNELFKRVITFAKRAHRETKISEQAVSISYVAVELAKKIFGDITDKHVVILGAGEMGELALKNLQGSGVTNITVVNRTLERAEKLAHTFHAKAVHMGQLLHVLTDADMLISSTSSTTSILNKESIQSIQKLRKGNPLFLIDIAVPRDIDSDVAKLDNVFLYDMDDLHGVVEQNLETRKRAATMIEAQLVDELCAFKNWVAMLDAVPIMRALREKSIAIQERTLESVYRKMPDLTARERKVLQKHMKSVTHQILEEPIKQLKYMGSNQKSEDELELFKDIFGLELHEES
ncbi:glutamyl-tRNA reductase [Virgibacillus soli]|uniref:glutamyl-tRNA reductase n=1 Tax=Paracerasibacillus soli TaxID=480284 RepID=UPI0035E5BA01